MVGGARVQMTIKDEFTPELRKLLENQPRYIQVVATGRRWGKTALTKAWIEHFTGTDVVSRFRRGAWR